MDTPLPRTSNLKHDLRPTQRDESPNFPVTSLINVNISGTNNNPFKWLPAKSNNGPRNGTDSPNAPVTPEKRNNDRAIQFLPVSPTSPNTIDVVSIQTVPPFYEMDRYTTNNPPVPFPNSYLQVRGLIRWGAKLDSHHTN